jgi:hypothetical protein
LENKFKGILNIDEFNSITFIDLIREIDEFLKLKKIQKI